MMKRPDFRLPAIILMAGVTFSTCKTNSDQSFVAGDSTLMDTMVVQSLPVASQPPPPHQALNIAVDLSEDPTAITVFKSIYFEDSVVQVKEGVVDADIKISSWEYIQEDGFLSSDGKCERFKILQLTRVDGGGTYLDWYTVMPDQTTSLVPLSVDITERQSEHNVKFEINSELADACYLVTVTEDESGGDIDLRESGTITFYTVDKQGFNEILVVQLTDKLVRDYYAEGAEPVTETNTTQDYVVLDSKTNGLYDIQINTSDLDETGDTMNSDGQFCKWNGNSYDCSAMMVD